MEKLQLLRDIDIDFTGVVSSLRLPKPTRYQAALRPDWLSYASWLGLSLSPMGF
jgi:hypothetical protein